MKCVLLSWPVLVTCPYGSVSIARLGLLFWLPSILKQWLVCQFEGTNHPIESCQPFMTRDMRWDKETFCFHWYPISQTRFFFLLYYSCFVFVAVLLLNRQFEWPTTQRGRFMQSCGVLHNLSCIYHKNETGKRRWKRPSRATIRREETRKTAWAERIMTKISLLFYLFVSCYCGLTTRHATKVK